MLTDIKELLKKNTMLLALVVIVIFFEVLIGATGKGSLFRPANIANLINQNAYVVILATGMLMCILSGGNIDLSVGSVVALIGAMAATFIISFHLNVYAAIVLCLLTGVFIGVWQGFWIAYVRIPAFIVTLAGMLLWRGVAQLVLNGLTLSPFPDSYLRFFTGFLPTTANKSLIFTVSMMVAVVVVALVVAMQSISRIKRLKKGYKVESRSIFLLKLVLAVTFILMAFWLLGQNKGVPVVLIVLTIIVLFYSYFTTNTVPGRYLYAMGGNEKAAKMSGINTNKMLFFADVNMGFLAAVTALVAVARFNSASPSAGTSYELDAIAACFIGGASAYGGIGTVSGVVIGAVFMGVLNNGMSILGIDANWQQAVKGLVLLMAVIFDVVLKNRKKL